MAIRFSKEQVLEVFTSSKSRKDAIAKLISEGYAFNDEMLQALNSTAIVDSVAVSLVGSLREESERSSFLAIVKSKTGNPYPVLARRDGRGRERSLLNSTDAKCLKGFTGEIDIKTAIDIVASGIVPAGVELPELVYKERKASTADIANAI